MSPRKRGVGLKYFYPRPPGGGRRTTAGTLSLRVDISIHALRVEGDKREVKIDVGLTISIHALRVEGDYWNGGQTTAYRISIHALRVEGDRRKLLRV